MDRIKKILEHKVFIEYNREIAKKEKDRIFCLHGLSHGIDVARISYIINLEEKLNYKKDVIYAMALLHDLGRVREYSGGEDHHKAGKEIARLILCDADFSEDEITEIAEAIECHKYGNKYGTKDLKYILYKADKLSRNCFACRAYEECYWEPDKKNETIIF